MKLEGEYDLSFFLGFPEYAIPGISKIHDGETLVPDYRISARNAEGKTVRPFVAECEEFVTDEYATQAVSMVPKEFEARLMGNEEFAQWVRDNTDLLETTPGVFYVSEACEDPSGIVIPEKYLTII